MDCRSTQKRPWCQRVNPRRNGGLVQFVSPQVHRRAEHARRTRIIHGDICRKRIAARVHCRRLDGFKPGANHPFARRTKDQKAKFPLPANAPSPVCTTDERILTLAVEKIIHLRLFQRGPGFKSVVAPQNGILDCALPGIHEYAAAILGGSISGNGGLTNDDVRGGDRDSATMKSLVGQDEQVIQHDLRVVYIDRAAEAARRVVDKQTARVSELMLPSSMLMAPPSSTLDYCWNTRRGHGGKT